MKTALVLGGGGSKGAYEVGVWKALRELGITFDIVTGTSIGSLIGAMVVQDDYDKCYALWKDLTVDDVITSGINLDTDIEVLMSQKDRYKTLLTSYLSNKGADITPFIQMISKMLDVDKFFSSPIDYGCMCVNITKLAPESILKSDMDKDNVADYLLASASCFPAFPMMKIKDDYYVDGGYYDNVPISLAKTMGADKIIAVDLKSIGRTVIKKPQSDIIYIEPLVPLGSFLMFDKDVIKRNMQLGYQDTMKKFKEYLGYIYTFEKEEKHDIVVFEKEFANFIKLMDFTIQQYKINKLYKNILDHQLKGTMKPYEMAKYKYLRILESCAYVFSLNDEYVYVFKEFCSILIKTIETYKPSYDLLFSKSLSFAQIGKEMKDFSHKDIIYYFYNRLLENGLDDNKSIQYLAVMFMDEYLMALVVYHVKQKIA